MHNKLRLQNELLLQKQKKIYTELLICKDTFFKNHSYSLHHSICESEHTVSVSMNDYCVECFGV